MQTNLSPMYRCADGNVVQFYEMAVPNQARTDAEGRPVNFKALMVLFRSPGVKNQIHHQEVYLKDETGRIVRRALVNITRDKKRVYWDEMLKDQLQAFREGTEGTEALGTPLEQYPKIDVAQAATFRAQGVHTLEQFRAVPDSQLDGLGPKARELRDGVTRYLDSMTGNSALQQQNAELAKRLAELEARMAAAPVPEAPKRRGRKPKATTQDGESASAEAA